MATKKGKSEIVGGRNMMEYKCRYCGKPIKSGGIKRVRSYHGGKPIVEWYHKGCARSGFGYVGTHGRRGETVIVRW